MQPASNAANKLIAPLSGWDTIESVPDARVRGPFFWVLRMSGPLLCRIGLRCAVAGRQKEVRMIQLDLGRDAPSQPVLYPLHTSVAFVVAKQFSDLGGSTKGLDHFWVGHKTRIKRDVYLIVKRDV